MPVDEPTRYLASLPTDERATLQDLNRPALRALRSRLDDKDAIAFLGAGVSTPLYPLWTGLISELLTAAADHMPAKTVATCRALAGRDPDAVVEVIAEELRSNYHEVLRGVLRPRHDPVSGHSWTPAQEAIVRCSFAGIVTTNYDPGILDARIHFRTGVTSTGFATWTNEDAMERWRTGDVFADGDLPVLYAHGQHNDPRSIVLNSNDYRRAYSGRLARVLASVIDTRRLVWIGFSFADQRIAAIIRAVRDGSGTDIRFRSAPRHIAIMGWAPADADSPDPPLAPEVVRDLMEIQYGCQTVLYPIPDGDHSALVTLLTELGPDDTIDPGGPPASGGPSGPEAAEHTLPASPPAVTPRSGHRPFAARWVHGGHVPAHFTGRTTELARLDRWAADPDVAVIGVTAWGGAGKTSLVTKWATENAEAGGRALARLFAWSFYEDQSGAHWAQELLRWAGEELGHTPLAGAAVASQVLHLLRSSPLLLVLDGLEVVQEGPSGTTFGRLLEGIVRDVLVGMCVGEQQGLALLTSRFPFADLEPHDGTAVRMLDTPPLTATEGAALLGRSGAGWLPEDERIILAQQVDGHALALGVLASALGSRPSTNEIDRLRRDLAEAVRTDTRVTKVLDFYSGGLNPLDRQLVALVSLFQRPVPVDTIVTLAERIGITEGRRPLDAQAVETAARQRLHGVLGWHPNGSLSAHPVVRDRFRLLALSPANAAIVSEIELAGMPKGSIHSYAQALSLVETIELLLDAGDVGAADAIWMGRTDNGSMWHRLPAMRLGQRCALAFVAAMEQRSDIDRDRLGFFFNEVGLRSAMAGDVLAAMPYYEEAFERYAASEQPDYMTARVLQNMGELAVLTGDAPAAINHNERALALLEEHPDPDVNAKAQFVQGHGYLAVALDLAGETRLAEEHFLAADELRLRATGDHIASVLATEWALFLLRTGRAQAARVLTEHGLAISDRYGWNDDVARCNRVLGQCALAEGDVVDAEHWIRDAMATFRSGDMVTELAPTLVLLAERHRRMGEHDEAERLAAEAINLAGPRFLRPAHGEALVARAQIRLDRATATGDTSWLERAADDADHAYRLATRIARLPWVELASLDVLVAIAEAQGEEGPRTTAKTLRAHLLPDGLDPDPLATVAAAVEEDDPTEG